MAPSNIIVDPKLLGEVALSIHSLTTKGETPRWWKDHSALVEYGIARFVDENDQVKIEEPLVLVAISRFFESTHPIIRGAVWTEDAYTTIPVARRTYASRIILCEHSEFVYCKGEEKSADDGVSWSFHRTPISLQQ